MVTTQALILRVELLRRGYTMASFARANGFKPVTVKAIVRDHWGKATLPRGPITQQVLDRLEEETGLARCAPASPADDPDCLLCACRDRDPGAPVATDLPGDSGNGSAG
jgi:hypothetical protein